LVKTRRGGEEGGNPLLVGFPLTIYKY